MAMTSFLRAVRTLTICAALWMPMPLCGRTQQEYEFSNGTISIHTFIPVAYYGLARRAGVEGTVKMQLLIDPTGVSKFDLKDPIADRNTIEYYFQQDVLKAVSGWKLINETTKPVKLELIVNFVLSGTLHPPDDKKDSPVTNKIMFSSDALIVTVKAMRIIPIIRESRSKEGNQPIGHKVEAARPASERIGAAQAVIGDAIDDISDAIFRGGRIAGKPET